MNNKPILFGGSSHSNLARQVCEELNTNLGRIVLNQFPDEEINVQILEEVRGADVYVLQSIVGDPSRCLMELLIMIDALKRASAKSITAVIPYLGYCRQDRQNKPGVPITAKLVANMLTAAGMTHLITFDLHADQVEGFFDVPVNHSHCQKLLSDSAKRFLGEDCIVVAPDIGSIKIAESMAKLLNAELAVIKKKRLNSFDVSMTLIGEVNKKNVLIVDDLCSTAGTLVAASYLCKEQGAQTVIAAVTHGLLVGEAIQKIEASPIEIFLMTDTIEPRAMLPPRFQVVSVAAHIAATIRI